MKKLTEFITYIKSLTFTKKHYIPLNIVTFNGKRFIYMKIDSIQCAYCLHMQPIPADSLVRDSEGFAIGVKLSEESHTMDCEQR